MTANRLHGSAPKSCSIGDELAATLGMANLDELQDAMQESAPDVLNRLPGAAGIRRNDRLTITVDESGQEDVEDYPQCDGVLVVLNKNPDVRVVCASWRPCPFRVRSQRHFAGGQPAERPRLGRPPPVSRRSQRRIVALPSCAAASRKHSVSPYEFSGRESVPGSDRRL